MRPRVQSMCLPLFSDHLWPSDHLWFLAEIRQIPYLTCLRSRSQQKSTKSNQVIRSSRSGHQSCQKWKEFKNFYQKWLHAILSGSCGVWAGTKTLFSQPWYTGVTNGAVVEVWESNKQFHPTLLSCQVLWVCHYLSMVGLRLIRVSKRGPRQPLFVNQWWKCGWSAHRPDTCMLCS